MSKVKTYPWDPAEHIESQEGCVGYLDAALQEDDPALVIEVIDDIARFQEKCRTGEMLPERKSSLYQSLTANGEPDLAAILAALHELGISLYSGPRRCTTSEPQPEVMYRVQPVLD